MATFYGNESLGIDLIPEAVMGLSWKAQLAQKIFSETGDKALKSLTGEHYWNVGLIDKLIALSVKELLPGADRVTAMSAVAKVTRATAESFLRNVNTYRNKKYTPSLITTTLDLARKAGEGTGDVIEGVGDFGKSLPWIIGILAVGVSGYLIFAGRKGVKLTP